MAYTVMAHMVMAYIVMAHMVMPYVVMAYIVKGYIVMAKIVMAYIVQFDRPMLPLFRLYIGIADGMSIARVWLCRYSK